MSFNSSIRKTSLVLAILFSINLINAQEIETQDRSSKLEDYNFYMGQHQKLKKTGYILLGAGAGLMIGGYAIAQSADSWDGVGGGALVFTLGGLSTIGSIPVFVVSGVKKRKAQTYLEGGVGNMSIITTDNSKFVAVSLKIDF